MHVAPGDRLLLCSDGLSGMVDDDLLESTLVRVKDPQRCADVLVDEAISAGGFDNITAVVVDVEGGVAREEAKANAKGKAGAIAIALLLVLLLVGVVAGSKAYLDRTAFITAQNGQVVICTGLPGEILGMDLWKINQETGVSVDSLELPPNTKSRLVDEGIQTDSVEQAEELLQTWQDQATSTEAPAADAASNATSEEEPSTRPQATPADASPSEDSEGGDAA